MSRTQIAKRRSFRRGRPSRIIVGLAECQHFLNPNDGVKLDYGIISLLCGSSWKIDGLKDVFNTLEPRPSDKSVEQRLIDTLNSLKSNLRRRENYSAERCMINRLITYIRTNPTGVVNALNHYRQAIRIEMCPKDLLECPITVDGFLQRERNVLNRAKMCEASRLFYVSPDEAHHAPNVGTLIDQTTIVFHHWYNVRSRDPRKNLRVIHYELNRLVEKSLIIVSQPNFKGIPVTIYQSSPSRSYTVKISVRIVSLLYDFMQSHPDILALEDIGFTLLPESDLYQIEGNAHLPWEHCRLQVDHQQTSRSRTVPCAEMKYFSLRLTSNNKTGVPFSRKLHRFRFHIRYKMKSEELGFECPLRGEVCLDSMPFMIGNHNSQIPVLLTDVIWHDMRYFLLPERYTMHWIRHFLSRYYLQRTGVVPNQRLREYLQSIPDSLTEEQEKNPDSIVQRISVELILPYVCHVELVARNSLLALLQIDEIFIGPCSPKEPLNADNPVILRSVIKEPYPASKGCKAVLVIDRYHPDGNVSEEIEQSKLSECLSALIEQMSQIPLNKNKFRNYLDESATKLMQSTRETVENMTTLYSPHVEHGWSGTPSTVQIEEMMIDSLDDPKLELEQCSDSFFFMDLCELGPVERSENDFAEIC